MARMADPSSAWLITLGWFLGGQGRHRRHRRHRGRRTRRWPVCPRRDAIGSQYDVRRQRGERWRGQARAAGAAGAARAARPYSTGNGHYKAVGGTGGDAGGGGAGGEGGEGDGGGLYLAGGTVTIQYSTIAKNQTSRGQAGLGGTGARGGKGGAGNPNGARTGPPARTARAVKLVPPASAGSNQISSRSWTTRSWRPTPPTANPATLINELDPNSSNNLFGTGGSGGLEFNPISGNFLGNIFDVANPGLAPLGDYGGPTQTVALLPGSPAIGDRRLTGFTSSRDRPARLPADLCFFLGHRRLPDPVGADPVGDRRQHGDRRRRLAARRLEPSAGHQPGRRDRQPRRSASTRSPSRRHRRSP